MMRRFLVTALVVVSLAGMVETANATCPKCAKGKIINYLFGGYGPGPFGNGYVTYAGHPPICNQTTCGRPIR